MAVRSIASHQQYLLSMHVLLITAAGCPLHGPELFIHTNRHKYVVTHTHTHTKSCIREESGLLLSFCLRSFLPSFLSLSLFYFFSSVFLWFTLAQGRKILSLSLLFFNLSFTQMLTHGYLLRSAHPPACVLCLLF